MPSGYTAPVNDGRVTTLEEYILDVSRGMAFAYHLRDSSFNGTIPLQKVDSYYSENYTEALEALNRWNELDYQGMVREWEAYSKDIAESNKRSVEEHDLVKHRYESMLQKVESWDPPAILQSTKDYALEQLRQSIDFDCGHGPYTQSAYPFKEWVEWHEQGLLDEVEYSLKSWRKAKERVDECNEYIKALYESLGLETP
jgi:hypothetical protein